jgi:serine/threonine-protein kinase
MGNKILAGRYEIHEKIGDGGMAVVYMARDKLLNRKVAIKILRPEFIDDASFVDNFRRESRAAAGLNHPNIVSIYDVGKEGKIYYIVMELIEGRPLSDIIAEKAPMDSALVISIGTQIASALAFAHKNSIIHRDVKPHNILITEDGGQMHAKIADFGIARAITDRTTISDNNVIMGSVHYFSPEQGRGKYMDEKSDIYSLGIVLYEMLTGRVPFDANEPVAIALMHMNEKITPPSKLVPGVPPGLEQVILRATEKLQVKRFATSADMKTALDNVAHLMAVFPDVVPGNISDSSPLTQDEYEAYGTDSSEKEDYTDDYDEDDYDEDDLDDMAALAGGRTEKDRYRKPKSSNSGGKKKPPKSAAERKRKKKMIFAIVLGVLLALILVVGGFFIVNHFFGGEDEELIAPKLVGMTEDEAKDTLDEMSLKLELGDEVFSEEIAEGEIAEQDPKDGAKVKEGDTITVKLSKGAEGKVANVPDVIGKSKANAQYMLEEAGLVLGKVDKEDNDKSPDTVIRQSPDANTELPEGSTVDIVISLGPRAKEAEVPNLLGLTEAQAKTALKNAGLIIGNVDTANSDDYTKGQIMWQEHKKGTLLTEGQKVGYTVSTGPAAPVAASGTVTIDIDLTGAPTDEVKVLVKVVNSDSTTSTVYDENCLKASGSVQVPCEGKGEGKIMVYFNSKLAKTYTANFADGTYAEV